jgi:hypothetical protein
MLPASAGATAAKVLVTLPKSLKLDFGLVL